jgi:homoserine kinase
VKDEAVKTRAPATTANLGPGFDCAAVALDLWNEVEVSEGGDEPPDPTHIGIRAFGLIASPEGLSFSWSERIHARVDSGRAQRPSPSGWSRRRRSGEEPGSRICLRGRAARGHSDNLAAAWQAAPASPGPASRGWRPRSRWQPVADPRELVRTPERETLPTEVPHVAASFNAAQGYCWGRARRGDASLLAARVRGPPARALPASPLLDAIRADLPVGAVGATLSGQARP